MSDPKGFMLFLSQWELLEDLTPKERADIFQGLYSHFGAGCPMPKMNRITRNTFKSLKGDAERSLDNYDERCKIFSEAGRRGGLKRAENARRQKELLETETVQANASPLEPSQAFQAKDKDNAKAKANANASASANDNVNAKDNASAKDKSTAAQSAAGAPAASGAADAPKGRTAASHAHAFSPSSQANSLSSAAEAHFEVLWRLYPVKRGKDKVSSESKQALLAVSEREMQQAIDRYIAEVKASASDRQWLNGSTWFEGRYRDYIGDDYTPLPTVAGTVQASARSRATTYRAPGEQFDWSSREE